MTLLLYNLHDKWSVRNFSGWGWYLHFNSFLVEFYAMLDLQCNILLSLIDYFSSHIYSSSIITYIIYLMRTRILLLYTCCLKSLLASCSSCVLRNSNSSPQLLQQRCLWFLHTFTVCPFSCLFFRLRKKSWKNHPRWLLPMLYWLNRIMIPVSLQEVWPHTGINLFFSWRTQLIGYKKCLSYLQITNMIRVGAPSAGQN